jgi:NAD(P)-dependent dehydrogenase (short-subunit alcohol dehydrogenase family)
MSDLTGKIAVVTGAALGLGRAIAIAYAEAGMKVAMIDVKADTLHSVAETIQAKGGECLVIPADLSDIYETQRAASEVLGEYGVPSVFVHNAAVLYPRPLLDVSIREWLLTVNVQIQAAFILTKAFWQGMTDANHGSIVFVSSQSGIKGFADEVPYCTGKHGLEGMMKSLALEGKSRNIAVNTITPGMYMNTAMSEQNYPDDLKEKWVDPMLLTPAFLKLASITTEEQTGERLNAWEMSEAIRAQGD